MGYNGLGFNHKDHLGSLNMNAGAVHKRLSGTSYAEQFKPTVWIAMTQIYQKAQHKTSRYVLELQKFRTSVNKNSLNMVPYGMVPIQLLQVKQPQNDKFSLKLSETLAFHCFWLMEAAEVATRVCRLYILLCPAWALCAKMAAVEKTVWPELKLKIHKPIKMSLRMHRSSCQMKTEHASSELFFPGKKTNLFWQCSQKKKPTWFLRWIITTSMTDKFINKLFTFLNSCSDLSSESLLSFHFTAIFTCLCRLPCQHPNIIIFAGTLCVCVCARLCLC